MTGLNSIPDDVKWRIAAEFSAQLPALYDRAFRKVAGKNYDEIEQEIWIEAAHTAFMVAKSLSLPVGTAQDLAETLRTVMILHFGPGFRSEALEVSPDDAVIIVKHCPLLSQGHDVGLEGDHTFRKCMAFSLTGMPILNKDFSTRFVRAMCTGDRQCEIKIGKCKPETPAVAPKK